jgi:hypothetical protein
MRREWSAQSRGGGNPLAQYASVKRFDGKHGDHFRDLG